MTILTNDFAINAVGQKPVLNAPDTGPTAAKAAQEGMATGVAASDANLLPDREAQDIALYLRHVEDGESIRALAREIGCHASTISRRIRRVEARRDDPLVDRGLDDAKPGSSTAVKFTRNEAAQFRRILRRLAEADAQLVLAETMDKAIVVRDDIRIAILDRHLAQKMALHGWILLISSGRVSRYAISASGRAVLKRMAMMARGGMPHQSDFAQAEPVTGNMQEGGAPFDHAEQHRVWGERTVKDPESGQRRRTRVNMAESPLQLLARRRDIDGRPFLSPDLVAAGERFREDFELSQLGPRVTQNWDRFLTAGADAGRHGGGFGGGSDSARDRVGAALRELGPGMGDMCLRVCCFLEGIEMTERRLGWAARSGKIVLRLGLMRLQRHYHQTYGAGSPLIG